MVSTSGDVPGHRPSKRPAVTGRARQNTGYSGKGVGQCREFPFRLLTRVLLYLGSHPIKPPVGQEYRAFGYYVRAARISNFGGALQPGTQRGSPP